MSFSIKIEKDSFAGVHYLIRKLKDPTDLLTDIGEIVVEDIRQRIITTKKDVYDKPFANWAPSTRKARVKDGSAALGILYRTGTLADSIHYKVTSKNKLKVGAGVDYAVWLNNGTNKMPAREFIGVSQRARQGINEALKIYFGAKK